MSVMSCPHGVTLSAALLGAGAVLPIAGVAQRPSHHVPDGAKAVYVWAQGNPDSDDTKFRLQILTANGQNYFLAPADTSYKRLPVFSPDGSMIAYEVFVPPTEAAAEVVVVNATTGRKMAVAMIDPMSGGAQAVESGLTSIEWMGDNKLGVVIHESLGLEDGAVVILPTSSQIAAAAGAGKIALADDNATRFFDDAVGGSFTPSPLGHHWATIYGTDHYMNIDHYWHKKDGGNQRLVIDGCKFDRQISDGKRLTVSNLAWSLDDSTVSMVIWRGPNAPASTALQLLTVKIPPNFQCIEKPGPHTDEDQGLSHSVINPPRFTSVSLVVKAHHSRSVLDTAWTAEYMPSRSSLAGDLVLLSGSSSDDHVVAAHLAFRYPGGDAGQIPEKLPPASVPTLPSDAIEAAREAFSAKVPQVRSYENQFSPDADIWWPASPGLSNTPRVNPYEPRGIGLPPDPG
jgi:hypothetical protein